MLDKKPQLEYNASECDFEGDYKQAYDSFTSLYEARAFCAFGKLLQLRDCWRKGWEPDWSNNEEKYYIYIYGDKILINHTYYTQHVFAFSTKEMTDKFLETFRDLLTEAKMFL